MSQKEKRDYKGDIKFDYKPDRERDRTWESTYVFRYYDEGKSILGYVPFFDLEWEDQLEQARKKRGFIQRDLYDIPDGSLREEKLKKSGWMLNLLHEHFREVFNDVSDEHGFVAQHKYYRVILTKQIDASIQRLIKDYGLQEIHDLIYEIVATGQKIYTHDVSMYDNREYKQRISGIENEVAKLSEVLERIFDSSWIMAGKLQPPELREVKFAYNKDGAIKINDPMLMNYLLSEFKQNLDQGFYKNWKMELDRYKSIYTHAQQCLKFHHDFTLSCYSLLVRFPLFKNETKTPNKIILCILEILELCLIPISSEGAPQKTKVNLIRTWLDRKQLSKKVAYIKSNPNIERLLRYFEKEFIDFGYEVKRADVLIVAGMIAKRFSLDKFKHDLAHIAQCIKESGFYRSSQLSLISQSSISLPPEFDPLLQLYKLIKEKKPLSGFKFKDSAGKEYELNDRLPLHIIDNALANHLANNPEDFEEDLIKRTIVHVDHDTKKVNQEPKFNLPEERFMVKFTKSFFDYLISEIPPLKHESLPSQKYYAIIAVMLQQTWFFSHLRDSENFIIEKVKTWHLLSQPKSS